MATGDIKNNIRKLKNVLKAVKYASAEDLDLNSLTEGSAAAYLPIYHYIFTSYSPAVSEFILARNFELYGKSDARFMEVVYKILRDVFSYKPTITKDQFFTKGFAERKIIMCTEVVQLLRAKHMDLSPAPSKTAMKASVRPKSAVESKCHSAVPKRPARVSPRYSEDLSPRSTQVVNELLAVPTAELVRHKAHTEQRNVTRHVAIKSETTQNESHRQVKISPEFITQRSEVPIPCENASQIGLKQTLAFPSTPSVKEYDTDLVEVVSLPKRFSAITPDISIVDVRASTSDSILQGPGLDAVQIKAMCKNVENLSEVLRKEFSDAMATIQTRATGIDPHVAELEGRIQNQLENLKAQIILIDNRLQMVERKVDAMTEAPVQMHRPVEKDLLIPNQHLTINEQGSSFSTQQKFLSDPRVRDLTNAPVNVSLNYSPIRRVVNGVDGHMFSANEETFCTPALEEETRRSSTPTPVNKMEPSFLDAASRIEKMVQSTNQMLKDQPEIPSLRNSVD